MSADGNEDNRARRRQRWLYLTVLPWLYCAVYTFRYGYDAPYWDQWDKLPLVVKALEGTVTISDYWTLINEHRVFIPNLILIPLAKATHWNLRYELLITLVSSSLAFAIFVSYIFRRERERESAGTLWVIPLSAMLWFSMSQHNIWNWGLHAMIGIALLFTVGMLAFLSSREMSWPVLFAAALCALGASLSFGTGIATWGAGAMMIAFYGLGNRRDGLIKGGAWLLLAAIAMFVYFLGYEATPANSSAVDALKVPHRYLAYVLAYLGGPLTPYHGRLAFVLGVPPLAVVAGLIREQLGKETVASGIQRFVFGAIFMAVGCAALTALKQWPEGMGHAPSSRYLPWSTLGWIGVLTLLYFHEGEKFGAARRWCVRGVAVLAFVAGIHGTYKADERFDGFLMGREALEKYEDDPAFMYLYPDPSKVVLYRPVLIHHRLTIFKDDAL